MASLSLTYLANGRKQEEAGAKKGTGTVHALFYTARTDLLPLLMATKNNMDKLPVLHLEEANA